MRPSHLCIIARPVLYPEIDDRPGGRPDTVLFVIVDSGWRCFPNEGAEAFHVNVISFQQGLGDEPPYGHALFHERVRVCSG